MHDGTPSRIQSDRGDQLIAASNQIKEWNFEGIQQWAGRNGIEWLLVPTAGQHFNGQTERMIGILKRQLHRSFEGKKYTHEETCKFLQEAAQIMNSHPLVASHELRRNLSAHKIL